MFHQPCCRTVAGYCIFKTHNKCILVLHIHMDLISPPTFIKKKKIRWYMTEIGLTQSFPTCRPWQEFKGAMADWPSRSVFFFFIINYICNKFSSYKWSKGIFLISILLREGWEFMKGGMKWKGLGTTGLTEQAKSCNGGSARPKWREICYIFSYVAYFVSERMLISYLFIKYVYHYTSY